MNALSHSTDAAHLPAWLTPAILLILLPFASGVAVAVFLWTLVRWAAFLAKIGSVICLVLAVLGYIDLQAASGYTSQLWMAIVGLHSVFGRRVVEMLMAHPVSAASLATGLCFGLVLGRCRRRPARTAAVE